MSSEWITLSKEFAEATAKAGGFTVAVHTESRGSVTGEVRCWRTRRLFQTGLVHSKPCRNRR